MTLAMLARNWWMVAARGVLAIAFGAVLALWPTATLSVVVLLFAGYAILDGGWAIGAATWASERARRWEAWPVVLEGLASVVIGTLALVWPSVPRYFVYFVAFWGFVTGALEVLTAVSLPPHRAQHWIMGTAAASSLFLALLLLLIPLADVASGVTLIAAYAIVFGILMISAALRFRETHANQATGVGLTDILRPSR